MCGQGGRGGVVDGPCKLQGLQYVITVPKETPVKYQTWTLVGQSEEGPFRPKYTPCFRVSTTHYGRGPFSATDTEESRGPYLTPIK